MCSVRILSDNSQLLNANIQGPELGKLLYNCCITTREMTQALVAFKLMDLDNDGYIPAEDLAKTQSVERKMVDDVLDDAGKGRWWMECWVMQAKEDGG
ncbi:hypothetical protein DUNSADRAFT_4818 [Dunaliella salina]|uniref:EF-hand domain-containing protein n=1 Tax=Dunaliella salina TaxID=3046 RepID=A0ABQ7FUL8_DUNSA|nr:hypothetical protein DUNSADRAFT_4818 [Dunaliella salina]|eukprot:KAF5826109.1 hypothetical protein DUNSADRAFT_4818 [Dunaliella salina]